VTPVLLVAGLAALALGGGIDLVAGTSRRSLRPLPYLAAALGSGLLTAAGARLLLAPARTIDLGTLLGTAHTLVRLDPLAGLFLTLTSGLGTAVSLAMASWVRPPGRVSGHGTGAGFTLALGSVAVILLAGDAFSFLFAWESLTVAFLVLTAQAPRRSTPQAAWTTGVLGKASGAALLFGLLLLAGQSHHLAFASWSQLRPDALTDAADALVVLGFAVKVGLVPFEVWLPIGYPSAPGPTRAAMAGIAVNVGFYGLWRFLGILRSPPIWLAGLLAVLGGITAVLGIVFAAVQTRLDQLIAYSSVENAGVIIVGYAVALTGAALHQRDLLAAGLLAATVQVIAHALAKSGLFASAAFFEADLGTTDLETLRGVRRDHPWSAAVFAIGALTLAGLPPTLGFVSEWLVLEALMQEFRVHLLDLRLALALAGALVALTAGVAALTFARLVGFVVLGPRRRRTPPGSPQDGGLAGRVGLALVGTGCLGLAALSPLMIRVLARGLAPIVPAADLLRSLSSPWVLQPVYAGFSALSPSWLWIVLPLGTLAVAGGAALASRGRLLRVRRVPAWRSATPAVAEPAGYTPFAYANALRHVLANVLGTRQERQPLTLVPEGTDPDTAPQQIRTVVVEPVVAYLYRPVRALVLRGVALVRRLQSGRLEAYVAYMLLALLAVLAVVALVR